MVLKGLPRQVLVLFAGLGVLVSNLPRFFACCAQEQAADVQWALAEHLSGKGEHYRAITEYERFIFYFPEDARVGSARVRILESYVAGKWWPEGVKAAMEAMEDPKLSGEQRCRVMELLGICHVRMGDPGKGREVLGSALEACTNPAVKDRIRLFMAELEAGLGRWEAAAQALEKVEAAGDPGRAALEHAAKIRQGELSSKERSPWTAAVLAGLFPGAGHAYLGRWEDAALVFMVNGAFLGATLEAVEKKQPALAGGMALAELLWYSGNIFSAVSNTHKHNRQLLQEWGRAVSLETGLSGSRP